MIIMICHTDWREPDPTWVHQPVLPFRRDDRGSWDRVLHDLGMARVDSIAIGCRGTRDPEAVAALPIARAAYGAMPHQPSVTFWGDTVGLPDIVNPPNVTSWDEQPFDFANPEHIRWSWDHFGWHFFKLWKDANLTRVDGKVLIPLWGIKSDTGHGFINQQHAQRLLDSWDAQLIALGRGGARFIVDKTWLELCPSLQVFAAHNWFSGHNNPIGHSIRAHHGTHGLITTGVVVPGFNDPPTKVQTIPHGGATARVGLQACVTAGCQIIICEGATDYTEDAHWIVDSTGDDSKLKAIREITQPQPDTEEVDMAITGTFSLTRRERFKHPTRAGYWCSPFPGTTTEEVLSVNPPDGHIEARPKGADGGYEAWKDAGTRAVFDDVDGYTFAFPLVD